MTNSTDKTKGPIRTGAVIPSVILIALVAVYFSFFFDANLRSALEYVGTQVNGAEVDIGSVRTSLLHASIAFNHIQITDKNKPERDIIEIGQIRFKLLWDALLRAKLVVDDSAVLGIDALVPRAHRGYVVPPPPPSQKGSGLLEAAQNEVLNQTKAQYKNNVLGDVASILNGVDSKQQLKNIQAQLKSEKKIEELQKELKDKQAQWDERIKQLPQQKDIKAYEAQIKALNFDTRNPLEFAKNLKKANDLVKQAREKIKLVEDSQKQLNQDLKTFSQAPNDIQQLVQEDLKDLQKRFKIPNIDAKDFSTQLFMGMIEQRLVSFRKYMAVIRKYMPPKKTKAEKQAIAKEQLTPHARAKGTTFQFPVTTGYPLFWLKFAAISSKLGQSPYSGNIKGELKNVTSDPAYIGKPATLHVAGDFPKQGISGVDALLTVDHTKAEAKESLKMAIASFPVTDQKFSDSPDVQFGLSEAAGSSQIDGEFVDNRLNLKINSQFKKLKYNIKAKSALVQNILESVVKGIPTITMNAMVDGSWNHLGVHINSNLGKELSDGFKKQVQVKIDEARAQLQKAIDDKIAGPKHQLEEQIHSVSNGLSQNLGRNKKQMDQALKQAQGQVKGGNSGKKLEDAGKKLLKKFGL